MKYSALFKGVLTPCQTKLSAFSIPV
jgi:hypothetical protein